MSQEPGYFRIGLFVLAGLTLLVGMVLVLGAGQLFEERLHIETYMDQSVQGLETGSALHFRGVKIGNVDEIGIVRRVYRKATEASPELFHGVGRYVYIRASLLDQGYYGEDRAAMQRSLNAMIASGLRLRLSPQGITGLYSLEAEYFDPESYPPDPPVDLPWDTEERFYVPAAPSLIAQISTTVGELFTRIKNLDIEGVVENLDTFLATATDAVRSASVASLSQEAQALIKELRITNASIDALLSDPSWSSMSEDVAATAGDVRKLVRNVEPDLRAALAGLRETADHAAGVAAALERFVSGPDTASNPENFAETLAHARAAAEALPTAVAAFRDTLAQLEALIGGQERSIGEIVENLRQTSENARAITENARYYPSQLLFGEPPPTPEVERP